jgi:hypothetical protein
MAAFKANHNTLIWQHSTAQWLQDRIKKLNLIVYSKTQERPGGGSGWKGRSLWLIRLICVVYETILSLT